MFTEYTEEELQQRREVRKAKRRKARASDKLENDIACMINDFDLLMAKGTSYSKFDTVFGK